MTASSPIIQQCSISRIHSVLRFVAGISIDGPITHPCSTQLVGSLGTFRNKIKEAAETTAKSHIEEVVLNCFKTPITRAQHIKEMFAYNSKHKNNPFLWRHWQVSDVPTGYKKPKKAKTTSTVSTQPKSTRIAAKDLKAPTSQYRVVSSISKLSSILHGTHITTIASGGVFCFSPHCRNTGNIL